MKVDILGVKIDDINLTDALAKTEHWIWNPGKHYIVTPNPEMIVAAQKDEGFKKILNDADLSIPDGKGLKLSGKVKNTFSGTDFMEKLVVLAAEKGFAVGFLGGRGEVAKRCAERLKKKYPGLKVSLADCDGEVDVNGQSLGVLPALRCRRIAVHPRSLRSTAATRRDALLTVTPRIPPTDILFVAFGHIKQEKWIRSNLRYIPVKLAMGVGGAFDYLSGSIPRAPKWIRGLGFEWLFRLVIQPRRIKRQLALLKYLLLLLKV